jgi:hypothetical protein
MPTELSWSIVLPLIADGFLLGVGWIIAGAIYAAILSVLSRGRAP